ncbi:hypothetical protein [Amycolatopsis sp. GA6-003]|uniref:hypothetical protein n=1 Tax=Amycolatopsis sp. GA6-003 TaxID=2652444 RepID=UPI003916D068
MPEGNPLVAESKKDGDGPGPFTEGNGDYGYATGINIAESATDAWKGIADGDWVSGGLGVASLAGEIAGAAIDPFGYLMSSVASFLMEHVQPLKDMLDSVAGNPPVIQSYADTWGNVAKALQERQKDLENAVKTGTAEWKGDGADAYRKSAAEAAEAIGGAATVASAIGTVTMIMGQVVAFVRGLVRQLIADLVGKLISWVMEEVFSLGFGTPLVVAQAVTAISKWGEKISELLTKLCETMRRVSPLLGKLAEVFTKIIKVLGKLAGKVTGLDVISTKNIKAGGFFHRGGSGGGAGGSGGGHHGGSGEGDADPGSPSGSRRSNGSDNADGGDGPNGSHDGSDGSDTPGDHSGDSGSHNGSDSSSGDRPSSSGGSHSSSPDGTGPSTVDTPTSSSRRGSDSSGGSHPDSSPSTLAGDASPTSRGGGSPAESSYAPQSSAHSDGPSSVSAPPSSSPHSSGAPHSSSGGGTHSGGNEPSPHHSSSNDSTSASGYAPPRTDAPAPQSAPPPHLRSNDGGGSAPNQAPSGGGIPQQGGGGSPANAPAGGGSPSPRPSGSGWTGTPGSRAPEVAPNRVPDSGPSSRRPSPADGGGPSRTPDRSGPAPQRPADGGSSTPPQRDGGSSTPQRTSDSGSTPPRTGDSGPTTQRTGDSTPQRPEGGGGSSPQRPADSANSGPQRPGDGSDAGQPKRPGTEPGLGRSEPAPTSGGSPASGNRGSGDGSAPPAAAVATAPGGGQRGPEAGARRPDGSPEPVARGGARTEAPPAKPGEAGGPQRTGKETPGQNGKPHADESGKPKSGDKPENTAPDKKPGRHDDAEGKPGNDKSDHKPDHDAPERKPDHADPKHHEDGPNHHDDPDGTPPHHDEPLSPDEVNRRHAEDTPAGSSYHRGDPELGDLPHRVQPDPDGRYTVDVHVTADGHARVGDRLYTPEEFADILRRNGNYDGRPIRLIGCDAGSNDFAHRLSRDLNTEVLAPSKPAWTDSHGRVFSSNYEIGPDGRMRPRIPPDGEWSVHRPDGTSHHVGDDGFAPDGKHHDPHDIDADSAVDRGQPPFNQEQRDQDMRDLRQENRDRRAEGLDEVRELNGNRNPLTDDVRRPHERALTTARFRDANGETVDLYSFSGKSHDWAPAKDGPEWPKSERLFGTKDAGPYRPELGMPDPDGKFGRTHDSEPKLLEEMVRHNFAARSGLDRSEIDDIVKKEIEKSRREEAAYLKNNHENMYREGLRGDTARARDRMDGALEEINRRGAERAQQNGQPYTPVTREDISGDLRMVVDLPSTKRDMIPNEYQICDSCTDVILQYKQLFPNVRVEVVNLAGERLM